MNYNRQLKILVIFIFLLPKMSESDEIVTDKVEGVSFTIDICKIYGIKSVIFLYAAEIKEMEMTTMVFQWTRAFSREGFMTTNFYFSQMHHSSYYVRQILRPLYIALISNYEAINEFSLATSTFDMSFAVWLVIFIYEGNGSIYCHNPPGNIFHLRFDSEMLVLCGTENILREWYSLDNNETDINELATWNLEKGITLITSESLYERRIDLRGLVMNTVIVKDSTFFHLKGKELDGIFGKLFAELCTTLNFTLKVVSKQKNYGIHDTQNHAWSGAIGEIKSGRADISISDFTMSTARLNVVDFTFPIYISKNCLYFKKPHNFAVNWSTYFLTFTYTVWIAVFLLLLLSSIIIIFIKIKIGTDRDLLHLGSDSCLEIWSIFCHQTLEDFPKRTSLKLAYFSMFLFVIVLSAGYSASLISTLTSANKILPFSSFETFVEDGTYKLCVFRGSADYDAFSKSNEPLVKNLMKMMIDEDKLPSTLHDAFNLICNNDKLAFHAYGRIKDDITFDLPCEIVSVNVGGIENLSIVLSKHNPFRDIINFHFQKFINNGMLNHFKDLMYGKKYEQPIKKHTAVSITCVISSFFFILIGVVLSICILFVEKYVYARNKKKDLMIDLIPSIKSPKFYVKRKTILKDIANNLTNRNE